MQFVYPEILFALFALAIPIIVHLFNFRRFKKVVFSNVSFLKEVKQETQSKSKLKHLLILASRLLALAAIILAFAQPYIPLGEDKANTGRKVVSIYIDNSFSMEAQNESGRLLDLARNKALEIVEAYQPTDQFHLVTNDFEGRHQFLASKDEMIEFIDDVQSTPTTRNISDVVSRQTDALNNAEQAGKTAYLLSDLQSSTHDLAAVNSDTSIAYRMVPSISFDQRNIYIDSAWFDSPVVRANATEKIHVRIAHTSSEEVQNIPLKLNVDGSQKSVASFNIVPGQYTDTSLYFTINEPGFHKASLEIQDHPISFDDDYFFSFEVAERINILEISNGSTNYVQKVFEDDPYFEFQQVSALGVDYSELANNDLIVINELQQISSGLSAELKRAIDGGCSVLVIPGKEIDLSAYNAFFSNAAVPGFTSREVNDRKVGEINLEHYLFKDVFESLPKNIDLPLARAHYKMNFTSRSGGNKLLTLRGGDCFLSEFEVGDGHLYTSAVSLEPVESNFAQHALFVTSLVRIAEFAQKKHRIAYTIGQDEIAQTFAEPATDQEPFHLANAEIGLDYLPGFRKIGASTEIYLHGQPTEAGNYDLQVSGETVDVFAFNFERDESIMSFLEPEDIQREFDKLGMNNFSVMSGNLDTLKAEVGELDEGKKLWPLLIVLALVFLAIEILLIKFLN